MDLFDYAVELLACFNKNNNNNKNNNSMPPIILLEQCRCVVKPALPPSRYLPGSRVDATRARLGTLTFVFVLVTGVTGVDQVHV